MQIFPEENVAAVVESLGRPVSGLMLITENGWNGVQYIQNNILNRNTANNLQAIV